MDGLVIIGLIVLGVAIATPIAAFLALSRANRLRREVEELRLDLIRLRNADRRGFDLGRQPAPPRPPPVPEAPQEAAPPAEMDPDAPAPASGAPPEPARPSSIAARAAQPTGEDPQERAPPPASPPTPGAGAREDPWGGFSDRLERLVAANWLIWLGAAALAMGGIFLVRYAWEQGYFGPTARTIAGFAAGLAMVGASEWMRRGVRADAPGQLRHAPLAVAAAGVLTLYAAVYAAGPLYRLIPPLAALLAFIAVSALAVGLAILHGPLLAGLGLTGGYIAPLLVGGDEPEPLLVLGYALAVTAAALFLVRAFNWRSMVWVGLVGAVGWAVIGLEWLDLPTGPLALSLYLGLLVLMATALAWPMADVSPVGTTAKALGLPAPGIASEAIDQTVVAAHGFWALGAIAMVTALVEASPVTADPLLAGVAVLIIGGMVAGWRRRGFELLPLASLCLALATIAVQSYSPSTEEIVPSGPFLQRLGDATDQLYRFGLMAGGAAVVLGLGGWLAMRSQSRKWVFAIVSAFAPLLILGVAFIRLDGAAQPWPWGLAAALLGTLNLAALEGLHRAAGGLNNHRVAASAYALAAFSASLLAVVAMLPPVWMTAMIAAHLPVLALLDRRFDLAILRGLASLTAMLTVARLVWPQQLLSYDIAPTPVVNELLILFGVPIVGLWGAARIFARTGKDPDAPLVQGLDIGALTLLASLVSVEIRHLATRGDLEAGFQGVAEAGAYAFAWTGLALGLAARLGARAGTWFRLAERIVFAIAVLICVLGVGFVANPLLGGVPQPWALDGPPLLNLLAPSVLSPAALMIALAWLYRRQQRTLSSQIAGFTALALALLYVTLEVRNAFHVDLSLVNGEEVTEAENYAYSLAWLLVAIATLLAGLAARRVAIRHAAMAVLALAIIKVFVFDMASLDGVLRAVSFLGLGVALIAIAFLYQRLVLRTASGSVKARG